ncbi:hypothetical protein R5H30_10290 [Sulfitobacter sp. D35]|uniref:hypothetical protein n=1 Tax=Sulfitobacter sp. D35 TaxID=3083252 RepID=UPI00296F23EE|nr:hypothetical protein [Sulfitobacter sp. D35]MDW4498369.1 hypothetical protein [Sulfitobacter sp. D35]
MNKIQPGLARDDTTRKAPGTRRTKLVTVHGTGAGDTTATGDRWWQHGSRFGEEMKRRLDLEAEAIDLEPYQWTEGPNSELQRRAAGKGLLERILCYEDEGVDYYLVGHSHGGSVIYSALIQAERKGRELRHLKQWVTVGTPFLNYRPNPYIFQRLTSMGLTIFASGIMALAISATYRAMKNRSGWLPEEAVVLEALSTALVLYGFVSIIALFLIERRHRTWFTRKQKQRVEEKYGKRWLGLWHIEDEAISALYNVRNVSVPIVPSTFLQPVVAAVQLLVVFGVGIYLIQDTLTGKEGGSMLLWAAKTMTVTEADLSPGTEITVYMILLMLLALVVFYYAIRLANWLMKKTFRAIGVPLSWLLNRVLWASMRERAWGDDIVQEAVSRVEPSPPEFKRSFDPLPEIVARPLREHSDGHAITTLNKVRLILGMSRDAPPSADLRGELSESLKWKELIHTSYFDVPEFVDLLAIGMHRAGLAQERGSYASPPEKLDQMRAWLDREPVSEEKVPEPTS